MDVIEKLQSITWCKETWDFPSVNDDAKTLLRQCTDVAKPDLDEDIQDIITRSRNFPINFPIDTVRLEKLKLDIPVEKLNENIRSTYPILHERTLVLMANFLIYKRKHGSSIEKDLYRKMTLIELIDRMLTKRSVVFMQKQDVYQLLSGESGKGGWESVGTEQEQPPLVLASCLSYDEMKLSAMLSVSGPTACINDGSRKNHGAVSMDNVEQDAIIIGIIGPRFHRPGKVECEDILITKEQNRPENGYGAATDLGNWKYLWRQIWTDFYQIPNSTYSEVDKLASVQAPAARDGRVFSERWARRARSSDIFDAAAYHRRLAVIAELSLLEANARAAAAGKQAYLNVVGAGLGAWQISPHQLDLFVLSFLVTIQSLLTKGLLNNVSDVNFAYIEPAEIVLDLFSEQRNANDESIRQFFLKWGSHPKGGINVQLQAREPSAPLSMEHVGKLLVLTYPWDGNAHPGNEFWIGKLSSSGDGAAACSTQISELHNAHINPAVCGSNTRVVGSRGLQHISDFCTMFN